MTDKESFIGMQEKLEADTGGGCSVCGSVPVVNVSGAYWLCGGCVLELSEECSRWRKKYPAEMLEVIGDRNE